jgi:hypothetical protein
VFSDSVRRYEERIQGLLREMRKLIMQHLEDVMFVTISYSHLF